MKINAVNISYPYKQALTFNNKSQIKKEPQSTTAEKILKIGLFSGLAVLVAFLAHDVIKKMIYRNLPKE